MGDGNQYLDIIILGVIAAFIILRLRSVLGRRSGNEDNHNYRDPFRHEGPEDASNNPNANSDDKVIPLPGQDRADADAPRDGWDASDQGPAEEAIDPDDPIAAGIIEIRRHDPSFHPDEFLGGARVAFEMILNAFAAGDQGTLKSLLSSEVYGNFSHAIDEREQAGETLEETLVGIMSADIVSAGMDGSDITVEVKFVSEQIAVTRNADGEVVDGDPTAVSTVSDIWTFARDSRSKDPNWLLIGTEVPE